MISTTINTRYLTGNSDFDLRNCFTTLTFISSNKTTPQLIIIPNISVNSTQEQPTTARGKTLEQKRQYLKEKQNKINNLNQTDSVSIQKSLQEINTLPNKRNKLKKVSPHFLKAMKLKEKFIIN